MYYYWQLNIKRVKMIDFDKISNVCTGCLSCLNICPKNAISSIYNKEGFIQPIVDTTKCIDCGLCDKACHIGKREQHLSIEDFKGYACWNNNNNIRFLSSSGGVFSLLAETILSNGGNVYAAYYDYKNKLLRHGCSASIKFDLFRKSKYIESNTGNVYSDIFKDLKIGKEVLFCGTPCQVSGLKQFLEIKRCPTENLITMDFFCHGVPSTIHFAEWLKYLEKHKLKSEVIELDFRNKDNGCMPFNVLYKSKNREIKHPYFDDLFSHAYYDNIALRRSCYTCKYKFYHLSDFTVGDYRENNIDADNKGVSVVIINSFKSTKLFERLINLGLVSVKQLNKTALIKLYKEKSKENFSLEKREKHYKLIETKGFVKTIKELYNKRIIIRKIKSYIKNLIICKK